MFVRIMGAYVHLAVYTCQAKSAFPLKIILSTHPSKSKNGNRKRIGSPVARRTVVVASHCRRGREGVGHRG
jgi:hypothetical protein